MTQTTHVASSVSSTLILPTLVFSVLFKNGGVGGVCVWVCEISLGSYLKLTEIHTWVCINFRWEPDLVSAQIGPPPSLKVQKEDEGADTGTALLTPCHLGKEGKVDPNISQAKAPPKDLEVSGVHCPQ